MMPDSNQAPYVNIYVLSLVYLPLLYPFEKLHDDQS